MDLTEFLNQMPRKNCKLIKDLFFFKKNFQVLTFTKLQNNKGNLIMQADRTNQSTQVESHENENFKKHHKHNKKTKYIPVDEQVVFHLIDSANFLSTLKKSNKFEEYQKNIETKDLQKLKLQLMQKIGIKKTEIMELLSTNIKPIPFDGINDIKMKLRSSLRKVYMSKKTLRDFVGETKFSYHALNIISETISAYLCLSELLKQCSVPSPVQQGFYLEYSQLWIEIIGILENQIQPSQFIAIKQTIKQKFLDIWEQIPHLSLSKHLKDFDLRSVFGNLDEDIIIPRLGYLLVDNKIQQCCTYYEIYLMARMQQNEIRKNSLKLRQFEDFVLIPKITKSDHIFSSHVLSLFKVNSQLKQRLLNSAQLQPSIGLRVVDLLKQDGRDYYNIYMYILRQHYKSIIYDHKTWYMVQDKLSFNKNFIEWFAEDMTKVLKGEIEKHDDRIHKIAKDLKGIQNIEDLELSILQRNQIIDLEHSRLKNKPFTRIKNPLYENDRFDCAQLVIQEISPEVKQISTTKYLRFEQFGVNEKDINFIDCINERFHHMRDTLLLNNINNLIGFDTQFRCVATKYQQQGVSLIQLSTNTDHFVIDFLKLQHNKQFNDFIIELLCNQNYIKVGHTISSDIKYLRMTLKIPDSKEIKSFMDITVMFKLLYPNEKFSSLTFMCQKFLHRKLSKYEQRGNWNRRPLKKTQLHYGALDAFSCVLIYNKIKDDYFYFLNHGKIHRISYTQKHGEQTKQSHIENKQQLQKPIEISQEPDIMISKQTNLIGDTYRSDQLTYNIKYESFLTSKQPKFLIDNMLKKLSNVMRNCGLDAQYIAVRDYDLAIEIAEKDQRIILTRDTKFFQRKDNKVPIYLIKERTESDKMFEQIKSYFKLDLSNCKTLSRCVKCNGPELVIIPKEEAKKDIKFKYEDSSVEEFWRCTKCRQIYWQGGMFQRAKQKYTNLKK